MRCSPRSLAVSGEADPALWRWSKRARLALRGRPRGCPASAAMVSAPTSRWWRRSARRSTTFCPQGLPPATRMSSELGWEPRHSFDVGLVATVRWYLDHQDWCRQVRQLSGYRVGRHVVLAGAPAKKWHYNLAMFRSKSFFSPRQWPLKRKLSNQIH